MIDAKKIYKILLFITFCIHSLDTDAQETINTARPTLSIGAAVLPEDGFQWEQGAQYSDIDGDEWSYDAFFRMSISKSTEVRILVPSLENRYANVEMKWMMMRQVANRPGIAFSIAMGSKDHENRAGNSFQVLGYRMAIEKSLSDDLTGYLNTGYSAGGYFGDLTLAYSLSNKFTIVGEYWHHQDWKQLQSGLTFLINDLTQLDINGGLLYETGNDYTIGFGFARLFQFKQRGEQ